jgi:hypothetical protein
LLGKVLLRQSFTAYGSSLFFPAAYWFPSSFNERD